MGRRTRTETGDTPPRQPSSRAGRVAVAAVFVMLAVFATREVSSLDVGFHLEAGEHILAGRGWPVNDPFSYTLGDHPYIDTSWGYQVLLTLVERLAGAPGMLLLHLGFVLAIFAALHATARLERVEPAVLAAALFLGGLASEMRFEVRPELLSYALLAWVVWLMERHDRREQTPLWPLPVVFLCWANCHSLYILGWGVIGAFLLGRLLRDRKLDLRLARWVGASFAVALLNPYGWRGIVFPFTLATRMSDENIFARTIGEFLSPWHLDLGSRFPFYPMAPIWAYRVLAALAVVALIVMVRRRRFGTAIVALAFLYLSFRMIRNLPLAAIGCVPMIAWSLRPSEVVRRARSSPHPAWLAVGRPVVAAIVIVVSLVTAARVFNDAYYISSRRTDRFGVGWNRRALPIDAAAFIRGSGLSGRMLNHLNFGGYLMWAQPAPVFIDGRLEVVGEEFYRSYRQILGDEQALEQAVRRWDIGWIVYPFRLASTLTARLERDARWRLVYADDLAVVYARTDRGPLPQIDRATAAGDRAAPFPVDAARLPGLDGGSRPSRLGWWISGVVRREQFPWTEFGHGLLELFRKRNDHAAGRFARAIEAGDGAYYEMYNNLGLAAFWSGRLELAERCYEIVVRAVPENQSARKRLAAIRERRGNR